MELTKGQFKLLKRIIDSYRSKVKPDNPSHIREFFKDPKMDSFIKSLGESHPLLDTED